MKLKSVKEINDTSKGILQFIQGMDYGLERSSYCQLTSEGKHQVYWLTLIAMLVKVYQSCVAMQHCDNSTGKGKHQ